MKSNIGIGELKAHLSQYVRAAQAGAEITIQDRRTPVARLTPAIRPGEMGEILYAKRSMTEVQQMLDANSSGPLVPPEMLQKLLDEERADRPGEWITART